MQLNYITKLIDLPDIKVIDFYSNENDLILMAEHSRKYVICPDCGQKLTKVLDRRTQWVKDSPILAKRTLIRLEKKRYYCCCTGTKKAHPEEYISIKSYARKTKRLGKYIFDQAKRGLNFSNIARNLSVSYTTVMNEVHSQIDKKINQEISIEDLDIETLSIDEFAVKKRHKYGVAVTDPENSRIIDMLPGRKKAFLIEYFQSWPEAVRRQIKAVSIDMWGPYAGVVKEVFPNATITVDKFHVVIKVNNALDEIRKEEQSRLPQTHRSKFFRSRYLLLKSGEKLSDKEHQRLIDLFKISPKLEKAWELKEELRDLLQMNKFQYAKEALEDWYQNVTDALIKPFFKAKRTIKNWQSEILNYFKTGLTNGYAEGINNKIKLIKRQGFGIPNFQNFKRRIMLQMAC
jgi:transposase